MDGARHALTDRRILLVDDEPANVRLLTRILAHEGFAEVDGVTDPEEAIERFRARPPDLVLLDLRMPRMDGFEVLDALMADVPESTYLPVLVLSGDLSPDTKRRALAGGAKDFLTKPYDPVEVVLRIRNLLLTRVLYQALEEQNHELERRVRTRTRELEDSQLDLLERLAIAAEFRDDETGQHTQRVGELTAILAEAIGLSAETSGMLRHAAPLHDVGKIGIPDSILLKPGALEDDEFAVMKTHTTIGGRILSGGRSDVVQMAARIAVAHHERWDGTGYPAELAGDDIPLEARIVALADFFDALTHPRPYRDAWPVEDVLAEIRRQRGRHFDPAVVDALLGPDVRPRVERLAGSPGAPRVPAPTPRRAVARGAVEGRVPVRLKGS